eukprot:GHVR01024078.1.p1 GENE.GHVR01024078.1~~GHVR01024078.1.p1  ORF type:complete len:148 (+),score=31.16 GHVR01024078.1:41-484(+)
MSLSRFEQELEFVQCLANPSYLQWLGEQKYLEHPDFVRYLEYLLYWKQPKYSKYLLYPFCLRLLDALQDPSFRESISCEEVRNSVEHQLLISWLCFDQTPDDPEELLSRHNAQSVEEMERCRDAEVQVQHWDDRQKKWELSLVEGDN